MKKAIIVICALALVALTAHPVSVSRVKLGAFKGRQTRVINNSIGEIETAVTANEVGLALVFAVVVDTNATTTVTAYTPAGVGQILVGGAGSGTNAAWYASGLTTNDWTKISSYVE